MQQFGYSLVSQPVMALLGVRVTGALALCVGRRVGCAAGAGQGAPAAAGRLVGVALTGNLVSGRVTYGLGVAFGLLALLVLTSRPGAHT